MNLPLKLRQNIFAVSIVILTLILLVIFKVQQSDEINFKNGDVIDQFYSETIKPIFTSESFDKKEVINFALKGDLVLDEKAKKVLQLRSDFNGKEVVGIKNEKLLSVNNNYDKVVNGLELSEKRKIELDSILENYSQILSQSIYKDENNSFAIDPNIGLVRLSLNKDLSNFVSQSKNHENMNLTVLNELLKGKQKNQSNGYLVFTPDTVFYSEYEKVEKINENITKNKKIIELKKLNLENEKASNLSKSNPNIYIDSNIVNITLDNLLNIDSFKELNFFNKTIDSTNKNIKLSFEFSDDTTNNIFLKFSYLDSANNKINYEMNSDDIGNSVSNSMKIFSGKNLNEWIEYGIKMDSISRKIEQTKASNEIKKDGFWNL